MQDWHGRVWMNPPYGDEIGEWMTRLADHGNGIALVFARTETAWFFESVWRRAHAVFFFRGRISFYHVDGTQGDAAGAPSCLVAYGEDNTKALSDRLDGFCLIIPRKSDICLTQKPTPHIY